MTRKLYKKIDLSCIFQGSNPFEEDSSTQNVSVSGDPSLLSPVITGVLSRNTNGFRFEEEIRKGRPARNPKLFDGSYVSMVRMQNGRYQFHLKTLADVFDHEKYAFGVYSEIVNAFKIMD